VIEAAGAPLLRYSVRIPTSTLVADLIRVAFPDCATGVDLTPGAGCFWRDETPLRIERSTHDFRDLPYADGAFDLSLYDPPHNADAGAMSIMGRRFGTYKNGELEQAVRQGLREAWRVCRVGALVRVTDAMHGQKFVRMPGWVTDELGEPFEVVYQVRTRSLRDPKWKHAFSARNNGSVYLAYRRGDQRHRAR
jgi:hypothetical protein